MKTYRLAAIDLDGTLLGSDHFLSPINAAAVRRVADLGASVVLASGRSWGTIDAFARQIGLPAHSPIVAYNGAMIRTHGGDTWFHLPLPAEAARAIVRFCADGGYHVNFYWNDELYVREDTHWGRMYQERTGTVPHVVGDLTRMDDKPPTKLLLIDTCETTDRLLAHFQAEYGASLYLTKTEDEYLEFMHPAVSKGAALAEAAQRLDVVAEDCIAFGDSYNDLPMLEWVGLSIAMENARPELKAAADEVAPPADENGVAVMLDRLFPVSASQSRGKAL